MYSIEYNNFEDITQAKWDIAFVGIHDDERDKATKDFLTSHANILFSIEYNLEDLCLVIDNENVQIHELGKKLDFCKKNNVIIDATSMTVAEMFLLSKNLYKLGVTNFDIIYVEPKEYTKVNKNFLLSDSGIGFSGTGIPSLALPFDLEEKKHIVFLLGYEGDRFADAMDVMQIKPDQVSIVFGIPSYKLNWERNSYAGNLRVIEDNHLNDRFIFCGANNSLAVSRELEVIRKFHDKSQFYIAPIGTKPQAIGCIPVICQEINENSVGLLWDHPKRKSGRTTGVSKIQITKGLFT
ncbi:hypothetical protein ACRN9Z_15125 [Shewanella frigidimarina]|uniref:hypothetical protein n=1 Tax=Shewanella frigidimarina TaxID=56812 RepID=UPI003D79C83B